MLVQTGKRTGLAIAIGAALLGSTAPLAQARVIGTMVPFAALTEQRLAQLPPDRKATWVAYLARSQQAMARDKAVLAAERAPGKPVPPPPPEQGKGESSMPLDRGANWYASAEAIAVADNIVSFQTPAGGWGKNQDRHGPPRVPGQSFITADLKAGIYAMQDGADGWSFVGTIDNDATITELRFLARVQAALPAPAGKAYRAAFLRGLDYLLAAELPGGGWPQVWPLQGGYHDAFTINDNAAVHVIELMRQVGEGGASFAFVPADHRARATAAAGRGLDILLRAQVAVNGKPAIWAQQYDPLSLEPVAARNFEPVALSTGESVAVLQYLMSLPEPSPRIRTAIADAMAWFEANALRDVEWTREDPVQGRRLVAKLGAGPLWARFYDPQTSKPVYGDRDRSIHDDVNEISIERRNGYAWFNNGGTGLASAFATWKARQCGKKCDHSRD